MGQPQPQTPTTSSDNSTRRVEPVPPALREKFELDPFYQKYVDAGGLPILSSAKVSPAGLLEAAYLIDQMLANREDVRQEMIKRRVRFVVMAPTEMTTDVPEQSHMDRSTGTGGPAAWAAAFVHAAKRICSTCRATATPKRTFSSTSSRTRSTTMACGDWMKGFNKRLTELFNAAKEKGLWQDTYAA